MVSYDSFWVYHISSGSRHDSSSVTEIVLIKKQKSEEQGE
jgi:hypothetical protein